MYLSLWPAAAVHDDSLIENLCLCGCLMLDPQCKGFNPIFRICPGLKNTKNSPYSYFALKSSRVITS
jgi:hypothetical protein